MNHNLKQILAATAVIAFPAASHAATMAHWRFENGPENADIPSTHPGASDSSGNGNTLASFAVGWAGYKYSADRPNIGSTNNFSVVNTGGFPAMSTQTGSAMQSWSPSAWTIEASFQPENGGYRTVVGRDSRGTFAGDTNVSALYLGMEPNGALSIKFSDVSGFWHVATSTAGAIAGFAPGSPGAGTWYSAAAVSDGTTLSLYLRNVEANGPGAYQLVASTNMGLSGSTNTALTAGAGSGGDWAAGNWTVGRGLYAGGHTDRAYGFIDEVRISDTALAPSQFLAAVPEPSAALLGGLGVIGLLRRRRK